MNPDSCRTLIVIGNRMTKNKIEYIGQPDNMYVGVKNFQYDPDYLMTQACFFLFITEEVKPDSLTYIINSKAQQEGKRVYTIT